MNQASTATDNPTQPNSTQPEESSQPTWQIQLLYDGACPLCVREVNFLQKKDRGRGLVSFVDITPLDYDPTAHGGIDFATAMGRIHALLPDGTVIKNVEVFRRVYEVLGMGWVYEATRWPLLGGISNWIYGRWADWRLSLTGRPDLQTILAEREERLQAIGIDSERCRLKA